MNSCYICGKAFRNPANRRIVYLEDDSQGEVFVGPDCFGHTKRAGAKGYKYARGGPRVFASKSDAEAFAKL